MTARDREWSAIKQLVAGALELPAGDRGRYLESTCSDPTRRAEAIRLLRACEEADTSPVLDLSAAAFAAPVVVEVDEEERGPPDALRSALAGRYTIEHEIGRGGMATVYLARDERHGRPVALKLLRPGILPDNGPDRGAVWFRREVENAARLSHPHILPLYDSGEAAGRLYYITPYVDGEQTLRDRLERGRPPALLESLQLLRGVARALACAHRHGLVHRDIKPANILITREGDPLVADFGVARGLIAARGHGNPDDEPNDGLDLIAAGTPAYMAPEQVTADPAIDHRADLYAFGAVARELLVGREFVVPDVLDALVDRLLAARPTDRPNDAAEVLRVLDSVMAELPVEGSDPAGTEDREAYDAYLKGRHLSNTRQHEGLLRALTYFESAVARDPAYARAHAGIAEAWTYLGIFCHVPPADAFPKARAAAEQAVAFDGDLVEGHATLAHLLFTAEWEWQAAGIAFERAIAMAPRYPTLRNYHASFLHSVGRPEEALAELAVARRLDPLSPTGVLTGRIYVDTRRPTEAIGVLQEVVDLDPRVDLAHQLLAHAYLQTDEPREAIASMQRAAALSGPRDLAQLAYVHARIGDAGEARQILTGLLSGGEPRGHLGFHIAMAWAGLGELDETFKWLEVAYSERASFMNLLAVSAGFDAARADPRFESLLRRMGLRPPAEMEAT